MDISDFIGAAKTFHVLGIKVTKDGDLINEWYSEPECRRNIYSATKTSHPVQLVLLSRKDYCL